MKKILIYVDSMVPAGGIERVISNLSNEWVKKYKVTILVKGDVKSFYTLDKHVEIKSLNVPLNLNMNSKICRIKEFLKSIAMCNKKLRDLLNYENPDYIYTAYTINSLEIFMLGKRFTKKLIISEHGSKLAYNKGHNIIKRIVYPRAYKISVPTKMDTKLYLEEKYPAIYIPHMSTFKVDKISDLKSNVVLNIGRLTADKQQIMLLEIWNELKKKDMLANWKLKIVGKGEEKEDLEEYIKIHRLSNSVELLPPTDNIQDIFKGAAIFAFTSRFEGFGMVLLEAMSFGVPCISFDCPSGPRDLITGESGFLIENNNTDEFMEKLQLLIENNELRENMGKKAYEKAKNWDNDSIIQAWADLFRGEV